MSRSEDDNEEEQSDQKQIEGWKDIIAMIIAVLLNLLPLFIFMAVLFMIFLILQFVF